jgi:hypothetical protein
MSKPTQYSQTLMPGSISVACNNDGRIDCKRCDRILPLSQIAFLTRTSPERAFEAWCLDCSLTLSQWALVGAAALGMRDQAEGDFGVAFFNT